MMTGRFSNSRLFKKDNVLLRFCWQQSSAEINSVVQGLLKYMGIATHYNGHNRGSSLVNFVLQCSVFNIQIIISYVTCGWGSGAFRRWWPPSPIWAGPFNIFMATTGDVRIIPSFQIRGYVLHFEHVSCVITNCGQYQWAILSLFSIARLALLEENITRKLLSLSLDLFFKCLLCQVTFFILFSIAIFSPCFLHVGLLLQYVPLLQSGN